MKKFKYPILAFFCTVILGAGFGLDIWFAPHRDVRTAPVFEEFDVHDFTTEFISNYQSATEKYLSDDGDSKIVTMTGTITEIDTNLNEEIVIELSGENTEASARFTLAYDQMEKASELKAGDKTKLTGVVSCGAYFDSDFNRYIDAVLEQAYFDN